MVDYTLTPNKSLIKPNRGTYVDTWDQPINQDWEYIDRALGGTYTIGVQAVPATPVALSVDNARYQQIAIANQTAIISVQLPLIEGSSTVAVGGMWVVDNNSNTFDVYLSTLAPGTNTLTLKAGKRYTVFSNGSGVFFADDSRIEAGANSGLKIVGNAISIEGDNAVLTTARGGTGFSNGYVSGQLLIGKADGTLARGTLTAGTNVTITNGDGTITINASGGGGTGGLTSIGLNTTLSGLAFSPSTINSTNTSTTLQGTLGISSGGTGTSFSSATNPGIVKLSGVSLTSVANIDINTETSGTLGVSRGGTGTTTWTLNGRNVGAVWASGATTLTSGTLPVTAGGTGISTIATANQAVFSSATDILTTGTLPVQAGGTGLNTIATNQALYGLGTNVITAGTLPVAAGGTGVTSWTLNASLVGAVWANTTGSLTSGTLPVGAGGTGVFSWTLNASSVGAVYATGATTLTSGTLPVTAGGTGVTTATGTAGNLVLSVGPTLTGLTTVERISATATGTNDAITSKVSTDANFTYIGKNSAGVNKFTVDGTGNVTIADSSSYKVGIAAVTSDGTNSSFNIAATTSFYGGTTACQHFVNGVNVWASSVNSFTLATGIVPYAQQASWTVPSDQRIKKDIASYTKSVDAIATLQPITFKYNGLYGTTDNNVTHVGLLAQSVKDSALSEIVATVPYKDPVTGEETDIYALNTSDLVFALINSVKELNARIIALEAKVGPS